MNKNIFKALKENRLIILIPATILTLVAFISAILSVFLYSTNCASEFNGNHVSDNVVGLGTTSAIMAGVALLVDICAFLFATNRKLAYFFSFVRIFNYLAFVFGLGAFLFQILDEYSLIGTILYPIVSGTVGDPVDPVIANNYFISLGMWLDVVILSLVAGILLRKKSHKILAEDKAQQEQVAEQPQQEAQPVEETVEEQPQQEEQSVEEQQPVEEEQPQEVETQPEVEEEKKEDNDNE